MSITSDLASRVRALIDNRGTSGASVALGLSRETVVRLASGLPVHRGSLALAVQRLDALAPVHGT
jgi:hypothetical protein